jgi:WD40 repeat protein
LRRAAEGGHALTAERISCQRFQVTPECIVFAPNCTSPTDVMPASWDLIVGLRDKSHLLYLDCQSLEKKQVSLNVNDWDDHVSFVPLYLCLSPDMKYLVVATDKGQHFVYCLGTNKRVRCFASHACNAYGKPKMCWHGNYLFSLSDDSCDILVYSVASERVVHRLAGHHSSVRDIVCHPTKFQAVSASFDKTVKLWSLSELTH